MSIEMKRNLIGGAGLAVIVMLFVALAASPMWTRSTPAAGAVREIVLDARDVAFGGNNPTLSLAPGERVRFVIRNTDPGVLHSITLPGIDDRVRHIPWGQQITFEVTVPAAGSFEYICPQHAPKMQGRIVVQ